MRRDQRELLDLVLAGMRATDGVYARLAQDVDRLVRRYPADRPLSRDDARILRRQVDEATRRAFGRTRRTAADSTLYRAIVDARTAAAMLPYRRAIARVREIVEQRDPDLWRRITAEPSPRTRLADALLGMIGMVLAAMLLPWLPLRISYTSPAGTTLDPTDPDDWLELVQLMRREGDATRLFQTGLFDPERAWVDGSTYRLSDRVWLTGQDVRRDIDRTIQHALRTGTGPVTLADDLQQYLNPWYQPLRVTSGGSIIVDMTRQRTLGAKHATNAARRLARTELMAVHGQATIGSAAATPGVIGVKWMLSNAHPESDPCDDKASGSSRGMPRGVYTPDEVPHYPTHPNEMCVLAHHHMSREELLNQLAEQYGAAGTPKSPRPKRGRKPKPAGQKVDEVFDIYSPDPKQRKPIDNALKSINKVHGQDGLPRIPLEIDTHGWTGSANGMYRSQGDRPFDILLSDVRLQHPELTTVHEIGHFIDHMGVGTPGLHSSSAGELVKWNTAVRNSRAYKRLEEIRGMERVHYTDPIFGQPASLKVDPKLMDYVMSDNELFARSYAQFVAQRSGNKTLLKQVEAQRGIRPDAATVRDDILPMQWEEDDFGEIDAAFVELFRGLGWMT